jgi:hypothetical protein
MHLRAFAVLIHFLRVITPNPHIKGIKVGMEVKSKQQGRNKKEVKG